MEKHNYVNYVKSTGKTFKLYFHRQTKHSKSTLENKCFYLCLNSFLK